MTEYAVCDPSQDTVVKVYPTATDADVAAAVDAAATAYATWGRTTAVADRVKLRNTLEARDRLDRIAAALVACRCSR